MARPRKTPQPDPPDADEPEPDEPEVDDDDDEGDDDESNDESNGEREHEGELRLRVHKDTIEIDLPRDGNERQRLEALAEFVESMS